MMRVNLHPEGPEFSRIISGMWRLKNWNMSEAGLKQYVHTCIDNGITTFDHADIYGCYSCQDIFGQLLKNDPGLRSKVELVSKCGIMLKCEKYPEQILGYYDTSKSHIISSVENSLRSLGTDYLDLLLIHRPDPLMDPNEIAEAFMELEAGGKVKYFGVSNFTTSQYEMLQQSCAFPLVTNQIEFSLMRTAPIYDGVLDQAIKFFSRPMIWSPLAGGNIFSPSDERAGRIYNELITIKEEIKAESIDQVALAWILKHPSQPLLVLGSGKIERILSQSESLSINLSREQWFRLLKASHGHDVP